MKARGLQGRDSSLGFVCLHRKRLNDVDTGMTNDVGLKCGCSWHLGLQSRREGIREGKRKKRRKEQDTRAERTILATFNTFNGLQ